MIWRQLAFGSNNHIDFKKYDAFIFECYTLNKSYEYNKREYIKSPKIWSIPWFWRPIFFIKPLCGPKLDDLFISANIFVWTPHEGHDSNKMTTWFTICTRSQNPCFIIVTKTNIETAAKRLWQKEREVAIEGDSKSEQKQSERSFVKVWCSE